MTLNYYNMSEILLTNKNEINTEFHTNYKNDL